MSFVPMKESKIQLGTIIRLHGIRGAVLVRTQEGKESALPNLKSVEIETLGTLRSYSIEKVQWMPKGWILKFTEVSNPLTASTLLQAKVWGRREDLPQLSQGEFYTSEIIGAQVWDIQ